MNRLSWATVACVLLARAGFAETQADIAARENDEGKQLMFQQKYADASAKFRDAAARTNEGKYYFNLCTSLYQEGKFGEAMTACNTADKNAPDDALKAKVAKLRDKIQTAAKAANVDISGVGTGGGGGDPNLPPPNGGNGTPPPDGGNGTQPPPNGGTGSPPVTGGPGMAVAPPPQQALFLAKKPDHNYTWSLGGEFFGGGGKIGRENFYGNSGFGVRFHGDYLIKPKQKIGVQGYLQITNFSAGSMQDPSVSTLDDFDLGVAAYKHFCPIGGHLCFTPLVGVHLAFMSPAGMGDGEGSEVFNYTAFGGRLELALSYAFGSRFENVISVMAGANLYSKVFASPSDPSQGPPADLIGLDEGGAIGYFGVGYTRRFDTPFGQTPFVTLE